MLLLVLTLFVGEGRIQIPEIIIYLKGLGLQLKRLCHTYRPSRELDLCQDKNQTTIFDALLFNINGSDSLPNWLNYEQKWKCFYSVISNSFNSHWEKHLAMANMCTLLQVSAASVHPLPKCKWNTTEETYLWTVFLKTDSIHLFLL